VAPEEAHEYFALSPEERMAVPSSPAQEPATESIADDFEIAEEVPGESYVPEWESLSIEATTVGARGEIAVLSLRGIIDTVSAETLRAALAKVIGGGRYKVVVDMSQVEYVSSGGWGTFTERLREVRRNDGDIKLFGMDPDVYYVFTMLGFNIVLSSFDILAEAIEDFEQGKQPAMPEGDHSMAAEDTGASTSAAPPRRPPRDEPIEIDLGDRSADDVVEWEAVGENILVAHLRGIIEASAVNALATSMMQQLSAMPRAVLFDLEGVQYISSTGWGQFASCYETIREWGGVVALYGLNADLYDIYSCLEFRAFIKDFKDRETAIEAATALGPPPEREATRDGLDVDFVEDDENAEWEEAGNSQPDADVFDYSGEAGDAESLEVEDVLGEEDTELPPVESSNETGRWPGDGVGEQVSRETPPARDPDVEEVSDEDVEEAPEEPPGREPAPRERPNLDEAPEREPTELDRRFVDMNDNTDIVDVNSAVSDKHVEEDQKIRDMGWENYGDRLKRRNEPKHKKKKED
jgi:anti-sigma B factor antagonist